MIGTLGQWSSLTHGHTNEPTVKVAGLSTDTRTIQSGQAYLALRGERFDGHDFIADAINKGASAVVVDDRFESVVASPHLRVKDTLLALQAIAANWRRQFEIPVVAVAGSNGKTTTKHLIARLLAGQREVHSTHGTLNNHIGVPLTLLGLESKHEAAVIEIGANHPGEVAALTQLVMPTVGVVTNAGLEHLEGFGSLEGAAKAEGELFEGMTPSSIAVINKDDAFFTLWSKQAVQCRLRTFSLHNDADVALVGSSRLDDRGFQHFTAQVDGKRIELMLQLAGEHNLANALAAVAAVSALGMSLDVIAEHLGQIQAVAGRLQFKETTDKRLVIDDTYNANPSSVSAALKVLAQHPKPWGMIFGGMGELGHESHASHRQVGREAKQLGLEWLWTVGGDAALAAEAFGEHATHHPDVDSLIASFKRSQPKFSSVLVKGSRFNRLERVVAELISLPTEAHRRTSCSTN